MAENGVPGADFFQGDVGIGLEKMRRRLLDLSKRNRLLHWRATKRSSLFVVDELPDELFRHLVAGRDLTFRPVPRPKGQFGETDARGQLALDSDGSKDPSSPGRQRLPLASEHASTLGLVTSIDLPLPNGEGQTPSRHTDRDIQTLHYPEDLEAILRSIRSSANLAITETGSNLLYLVFGFLEWFESSSSNDAALAPLLLVPVTVERLAPERGSSLYRYAARYSGEDTSINVTLQELLKRDFGLELPLLEEDEEPEAYFTRVGRLCSSGQDPRWCVRRRVALTMLSFGKMLIYRDLDSRNWPQDGGPAHHPRVREFFEGIQHETFGSAPDYDLDTPPAALKAPLLVDEADSSQHSALLDAVEGKNLVIQGPPGTGKSQTIANLIAAALDAGKTVLFVSEKLAALEVVRNRLDKVGLGHFCLELHSHKTQKRRVLDDLVARLKRRGSFPAVHALDRILEMLGENRTALNEYSRLVNQPFGDSGKTLHDILWTASLRKRTLGVDATLLEGMRLSGAAKWSAAEVEDFRRAAEDYAAHCAAVSHDRPLREHPWYDVDNAALTFLDGSKARSLLERLADSASTILAALEEQSTEVGGGVCEASQESISTLCTCIGELLIPTSPIARALFPRLRTKDTWTRLATFESDVARYRALWAMLSACGYDGRKVTNQQLSAARIGATHATSVLGRERSVGDVVGAVRRVADALESVRIARRDLEQLGRLLAPITLPLTGGGLESAGKLLALLALCPVDLLALRHPGMNGQEARLAIEHSGEELDHWRKQHAALKAQYDLDLLPALDLLRGHVRTLSKARWWSTLTSEYRRTRATFRALHRVRGRPSRQMMLDGFRQLTRMAESGDSLGQDRALRAACGPSWRGPDTPFEDLRLLATWIEQVQAAASGMPVNGGAGSTALADAPSPTLVALCRFAEAETGARARAAIEATSAVAHLAETAGAAESWDALDKRMRVVHEGLCEAESALQNLALGSDVLLDQVPRIADAASELLRIAEQTASDPTLAQLLGSDFKGVETDLQLVANTMQLVKDIVRAQLPATVEHWLLASDEPHQRLAKLREFSVRLRGLADQHATAWQEAREFLGLSEAAWTAGSSGSSASPLAAVIRRSRLAIEHEADFPTWLDYARARRTARRVGLGRIVPFCEEGRIRACDCVKVADYLWYDSVAREVLRTHPVLSRFSGISHEQIRRRFGTLDRELLSLTRKRVASRTDLRPVPIGQGTGKVKSLTELSLLKREVAKSTKHVPIRELVGRAGGALQGLKPCFMMGPLSVAQYLAPGKLTFDIVVMDEASQLKPEDAIGAVARGTQIVIVGDRMQLPPTTFFERIGDDSEEDEDQELVATGAESILDVAAMLYQPERMLRWHYRSRHPSLIAYSNHEFYHGELITYPSPVASSHALGVKRVFVSSGQFEHRRNMDEAVRVVDTAVGFMRTQPRESLGIVALNIHQAELIEELLDQRLKKEPEAQEYLASWQDTLEPMFVKNLENVQGDERDVIYISVTYGPSPTGQVYQRFGPINGAFGHRRLNVLFTRAKHRTVVFTSLRSDQIQASATSAWGVRALRGFLEYAESGRMESAFPSGREPDSPFEIEVAEALKARGLDVAAQVGFAGYYIDLAVRDRRRPGRFALGIECDGWTYHRSKCARDRDRLRQQILEDLGWCIHRIWSTDWFKNPEGEADRVLVSLEAAEKERTLADLPGDVVEESSTRDGVVGVRENVMDYGWQGEVIAQPLSAEDAKEELEQLRGSLAAKYPSVSNENQLLTDRMIARLLQQRPRTEAEWFRRIPFELRVDIAEEHMKHLGDVLRVMNRMGH